LQSIEQMKPVVFDLDSASLVSAHEHSRRRETTTHECGNPRAL